MSDKPTTSLRCPVCAGTHLESYGPPAYRQPTTVASVPFSLGEWSQRILRCANCTYWFLDPPIPESKLLECYIRASADIWVYDENAAKKRAFPHKSDLLREHAPGRCILDLGCYDGRFLESLGPEWERFGIEPSDQAAEIAKKRGVKILGKSIHDLPRFPRFTFDAIVLFDIIEHVTQPVHLLEILTQSLRTGGVVLIETGNTDSSPFRRHGKLHSYCGHVEHVGFFNRTSLEYAARQVGLEITDFEPTHHQHLNSRDKALYAVWNSLFEILRRSHVYGVPLPARLRTIATGSRPRPGSEPDHFLALLRKKPL